MANDVGGLNNPDAVTYAAHILHRNEQDWTAKSLLEGVLKSHQAFSMKPEALKLYELVKDAKPPAVPSAKTP